MHDASDLEVMVLLQTDQNHLN